MVYDVTNVESFRRVPHWVDIARNRAGSKKLIIVGNKTDLYSLRKVSMREGMELAGSLQSDFLETSALQDPDVRDMLIRVITERCFKAVYIDRRTLVAAGGEFDPGCAPKKAGGDSWCCWP